MRLTKRLLRILVLASLAPCVDSHAEPAQDDSLLRAAFVYNFAKFTRWPETAWSAPGAKVRLCTTGTDGTVEALQGLGGKVVRGYPLDVRGLVSVRRAAECHILYIAASEPGRNADLIASVQGKPVLTISHLSDVVVPGVIIRLFERDGRIRFDIDVNKASGSHLAFSARLLNLAEETR